MIFLRRKDTDTSKESLQALASAKKSLRKTKARSKEVSEVSTALRTLRERNHFMEKLGVIMEGPSR